MVGGLQQSHYDSRRTTRFYLFPQGADRTPQGPRPSLGSVLESGGPTQHNDSGGVGYLPLSLWQIWLRVWGTGQL